MKSARIRGFPSPYFAAFGLNMERYSVSLRIQSECGKIQTRETPNSDTFHAVEVFVKFKKRAYLFPCCCMLLMLVKKNCNKNREINLI